MLKTLDLFAGVGGVCLGFQNAGFDVVLANDFDKNACTVYGSNFSHPIIHKDIHLLEGKDIPDVDLVLFGFPCQAFSIAGYQKGFLDKRGLLFFEALRIIKEKQPKVIFLENVKNLISHNNGETFEVIKQSLGEAGYHFKYQVLNTCKYGNLPQNRERIYLVGFKDKEICNKFQFPKEIPLTVKVSDITNPHIKKDNKYYYNERYKQYQIIKDSMKNKDTVYQFRRKYIRENKKGLCPTLTAAMGAGGNNVPLIKDDFGDRKLTPRECFLLQGFPKDFIFPDNLSDSALYKESGNSVSVPVIERIAKEIYRVLQN